MKLESVSPNVNVYVSLQSYRLHVSSLYTWTVKCQQSYLTSTCLEHSVFVGLLSCAVAQYSFKWRSFQCISSRQCVPQVVCARIISLPPADLRRALVRKLKRYTRKATPTGVVLGSGTFGSVIELTSAGETVAGKIFRMTPTVDLQAIDDRISAELIMMAQLHHPNIVQCKGVSLLVDQPLPVLLMERLMNSLHAYLLYLDNSILAVERKVSILRDTASGLDYLHSHTPAIIHRDLTAKNVLLDSELRAKIADFGNSRIMDLDPNCTPQTLTSLPGTLEYMPPEAQGGRAEYDPSLDVFSFGHLSLFTITQTLVQPLPSTYYDDSSGEVRARSEVKRRWQFVEAAELLLSENQSLVTLMKLCLHNSPAQRPHTGELLTRLQEMMTTGEWSPPYLPTSLPLSLCLPLCVSQLNWHGIPCRW